jgi:hypothetical protein
MSDLRQSLRSSVAASTAPYGYTLTVWASGAIAIALLGTPDLLDVLLLMAGAVLAFVSIEALAYGSVALRIRVGPPPEVTVWGSAHWISSGLAIVAVWGSDHLVRGPAGWALSGLLATTLYLLVNSTQVAIATRRISSLEGRPDHAPELPVRVEKGRRRRPLGASPGSTPRSRRRD